MAIQDVKYDAFISYRHTDLDQFVAQNIHHELEKFRLPRQLVKEHKLEKTKVERVFRDKEELTLANDLNNPLYHALVNSEYLIVICTPRLKDSEWCMKEIDTFSELHGKNRILLVLAEGEPDESFPEQLRFVEEEVTDEDGNVKKVRREVEPLAADVRGKNKSVIKKKIKEEIIRILAAMFQVNYDEIRQRHKEQKIKKTAMISLICSGVFLCVGAYSISTALQIRSQSRQIEAQNAEIMGLMDELDEQYNKVQINYARALAETSSQLLINGERMEALYIARSVLHREGEEGAEFNIPEAQKALSDALFIYDDGSAYVPIRSYYVDSQVDSFELSRDGTKMIVKDLYNRFHIWNLATNEKIFQSEVNQNGRFGFENDEIIYSTDKEGLYIYDLNTNINTLIDQESTFLDISRDGKYYAYFKSDSQGIPTIIIAETKDSKIVSTCEIEDLQSYYRGGSASFSQDGRTLLFIREFDDNLKMALIDVATGNVIKRNESPRLEHLTKFSIHPVQNGFLLGYSELLFGEEVGSKTKMIYYDGIGLEELWQNEIDGYYPQYKVIVYEDKEYVIGVNFDRITVWHAEDGSLYFNEIFEESIVQDFALMSNGFIVGFTKSGRIYSISMADGESSDLMGIFNNEPGNCSDFSFIKGGLYYLPMNSRKIIQYEFKSGRGQEILYEGERYDYDKKINTNGTLYFYVKDSVVTMYEMDTLKERFSEKVECSNDGHVSFVGDGEEYFVAWKWAVNNVEWTIYDSKTGEKVERYFINDNGESQTRGINDAGTVIFCNDVDEDPSTGDSVVRLKAYDVMTGKLIGEMPFSAIGERNTNIFADDMSVFASVDAYSETVSLYHPGEEKPYAKKTIPGVSTGTCVLSPDGKFFACSDCYSKIIIYETENLNLVKEFEDEMNISSMKFGRIDDLDIYYVRGLARTYFLNNDGKAIGCMYGFHGYDANRKLLIQNTNKNLYGYPYYTLDMLLDEADEVLKDYELPENIREKYGLEK